MLRPELGTKRACVGCAARFYDLTRSPPVCPKCGVAQPPDMPRMRAPARIAAASRRAPWRSAPVPVPVTDDPAPDAEVAEDEDEAEAEVPGIDEDLVTEDADELGLKTAQVD